MNPVPKAFDGWTVLVVEDELDSMDVAYRILTLAGATVLKAANGRHALNLLQNHSVDFILSDLSMPIMDGWELLEVLKEDRRTMDIPVIALTAHTMPGDREKAICAGFHNYISKPLDLTKLIQQLVNVLVDLPQFHDALLQFT